MLLIQFVILQVIVFSVVIYFLRKLLTGETQNAINRLGSVYQDLLAKQKELAQKIEVAEKEYQDKKAEAESIAEKLKNQAVEEARVKGDEVMKKAKGEADETVAKAQASAEQFYHEIEIKLSEKTVDFTGTLFEKALSGPAAAAVHKELVREFIQRGRDFDLTGVGPHINTVTLKSALPLTDTEQDQLKALVRAKVNRDLKYEVAVDKTLIAGMLLQFGTLLLDGSLSSSVKDAADEMKKRLRDVA